LHAGASLNFDFHTNSKCGAILVLPKGASSSRLYGVANLRHFTTQHGKSWYQFANESLGWDVPNGNLCVVIGTQKASDFGVAAFECASCSAGAAFSLKAATAVAGQMSASFVWETQPSIHHRSGPQRPPVIVSPLYSGSKYSGISYCTE